MDDTICAIGTSLGIGSISIIKISGENSIKNVSKIFSNKSILNCKSHTIHYGYIKNKEEIIDEVLVSIMKAPKSYTTEDVVEINCHGGIITTNKILELLLNSGCRLAEPGEFTKRAFLNGRIDLIEADAIQKLISCKSEQERKLSINQLTGKITTKIRNIRNDIINILTNIEVNIDYPEYDDINILTNESIKNNIIHIQTKLKTIVDNSHDSKIINNGINVVILGKPNVGKSSLLNALLDENKAIVTNIAGTTRDIVEGSIYIDGFLINLKDTAGIRKTKNIVEKLGVDKSLDLMSSSDLIIFVLNNNEKIDDEEFDLIKEYKNKSIIFLNKTDLETKIAKNKLEKLNYINGSILNNIGIEELKRKIKDMFNFEKISNSDYTYLTNSKQISDLTKAYMLITSIIDSINKKIPIDIIAIDLKEAWNLLGLITGDTYKEELLDEMFSRFCLGK